MTAWKKHGRTDGELIRGRFTATRNGFGFVARDGAPSSDVFIPPGKNAGAINGDTVEVLLSERGARGPAGRVVGSVARPKAELVGVLLADRTVRALDPHFPDPVRVSGSLRGAKRGDWLRLTLSAEPAPGGTRRASGRTPALHGTVGENFGKAGTIASDLSAIAAEYGVGRAYTPEENAAALRIRPRALERRDLRKKFCVTLDPADAKDFDDALSIERGARKGELLLGVHIADVAAYIRPGSRFAGDARKRGFSSYMPGMFRPMLPPALTARLSLAEGVDSSAHTVLFKIRESDGKILSFERFHSTIRVVKRLDYDTVQAFLDDPASAPADWSPALRRRLGQLAALARKLRENRAREELFLDIATPEIRIRLDEKTMTVLKPERMVQRESEQLVEECMLAANSAVASEFVRRGLPGLFRVHPEPLPDRLAEFTGLMRDSFGLRPGDLSDRKTCREFLDRLPADHKKPVIASTFLRSIPRASYSTAPGLHYGLGKYEYSHFTSPIRRYPDLLVHQQLWAADSNGKKLSETALREDALFCTRRELSIDEAYFAASDRLKLHFLKQQGIADTEKPVAYEGVIAKIASDGILCDIPELGIYGFVPMNFLAERMRYRSRDRRIRAERGRGGYRTGNFIYLVLDSLDIASGRAVFRPVS